MTPEVDHPQHTYAQLCDRLGVNVPLTLLQIGATQSTVVSQDKTVSLALGYERTSALFFHHLPPTEDEMERAIMTVEDAITGIRHQIDNQQPLYLYDAAFDSLAQAVGVAPSAGGWHLTQDDIEQLFKRFEQVMLGRPAQWEAIPLDNGFSARLLILREFMHHLGFQSVCLVNPHA